MSSGGRLRVGNRSDVSSGGRLGGYKRWTTHGQPMDKRLES